jgi:interleukin-1 receptor-associated kinase 1
VWLDVYVAYADTDASIPREDDFRMVLYDTRLVDDPAAYLQAYGALMRTLVARAVGVGGGGGEAGTARQLFFATGEARYASDDPNGTMYGMVQCMRDITAADCDRCLQASVPRLPCCEGNQGGVVLAYNCFLRIQVYTYYDLALDAPPSAAAQPPPVPSPSSPTPAGETSGECVNSGCVDS